MTRFTKEEVLDQPLRTEEFPIPEWGDGTGSVLLGEWPIERSAEVIRMFAADGAARENPELMAKIFIMGCLDPVFTEEDLPQLLKKSGSVMLRAGTRIMELNGLTAAAANEARGNS